MPNQELLEKYAQRKHFEDKMNEILRETDRETPRIQYNVNLFTHIKTHYDDEKERQADIQNIKDLAVFIKKTAIPDLVESLHAEEKEIYDSDSLSNLMHSYGINVRYLGEIIDYISKANKTKYARVICERSVYSRSVKHVVNKYLRAIDKEHTAPVIAHFLNLALSPASLVDRLQSQEIVYESPPVVRTPPEDAAALEEPHSKKPGASKRKGGKKNKNHPTPASTAPSSMPLVA